MTKKNTHNTIFTTLIILTSFLVTGCMTPVKHDTPSGKVEVTINGVSKPAVKERLTESMVERGYLVTKSDDVSLVFDRPDPANVFAGSRANPTPNIRISYQLIQKPKAVRIIADYAVITNPGTGYEQRTDYNDVPDSKSLQDRMDLLKRQMEER